jgi:CheY-like chemotaxis protein/anti-sigma regulatory factor (Ser/Thr protein kinase)
MTAVDLNALVEDVLTFTRPLWKDEAEARDVRIDVAAELGPEAVVHGNASELQEALTNLVINAVDAMPRGGRITVGTRGRGDAVEVSVTDTGEGIAPDVRPRIFDPFFTTRSPMRAGLGLSVVHGIVARHRGLVDVRSEPTRGATLTLVIPAARGLSPAPAASSPPAPVEARRGSVLVVEDEEHLRQALIAALEAAGHAVDGAATGLDGLARVRERQYDAVITDLSMPGCSGLDLTHGVKTLRPGTPVILMTGWGDLGPRERLRDRGVDRVLVKPFAMEHVLRALADVLARGRPR